ncbi:MAG: flagellar motor switch protein FliM [Gammaproteobacteria bacterium]
MNDTTSNDEAENVEDSSEEVSSEEVSSEEVSSEEVDALLEKEPGAASGAGDQGSGLVRAYDLVAPDKIVRSRMPAFDRINERWIGEYQQRLSEIVRRPLEVTANDVQITAFGEWLSRFESPASLNILGVNPWGGSAMVAVGGKLLFVLVDSYYGGSGQVADMREKLALTPTEERLNRILVDTLIEKFCDAFEPIAALQFDYQRTEVNPHYASIATPSEPVVISQFDVSLNDVTGPVSLVMPLSMLDPVREKLLEDLKTVSPESRERWYRGIRKRLEATSLDLTSVFLESDITLRELLALKPGDILPIEMPKTTTLCAGGRPLLTGKFGRSHGYNAVSIVRTVPPAWNDEQGKERTYE